MPTSDDNPCMLRRSSDDTVSVYQNVLRASDTAPHRDLVIQSSDGKTFHAHRLLIASLSSFVGELMMSVESQSHDPCLIVADGGDSSSSVLLSHLLTFIYSGGLISSNKLVCTQLIDLMRLLRMDRCAEQVKTYVRDDFSPECVVATSGYTAIHDCPSPVHGSDYCKEDTYSYDVDDEISAHQGDKNHLVNDLIAVVTPKSLDVVKVEPATVFKSSGESSPPSIQDSNCDNQQSDINEMKDFRTKQSVTDDTLRKKQCKDSKKIKRRVEKSSCRRSKLTKFSHEKINNGKRGAKVLNSHAAKLSPKLTTDNHSSDQPFVETVENAHVQKAQDKNRIRGAKIREASEEDNRATPGVKKVPCPHCERTFPGSYKMKIHVDSVHLKLKRFKCPMCPVLFSERKNIKTHMRTHTGERPFTCKLCPHSSSTKQSLNHHVLTQHLKLKTFICHVCDYRASRKHNLDLHIRKHSAGDKPLPFKCDKCAYSTLTKYCLDNHLLTHTGAQPFLCHLCSYSSKQLGTLKYHIRTKHQLESHFKCHFPSCSYSNPLQGRLKMHMRTHTGEKPFACNIESCNYQTAYKINLDAHLCSHTGGEKPFRCGFCSYSASIKRNYTKHMKTHNK